MKKSKLTQQSHGAHTYEVQLISITFTLANFNLSKEQEHFCIFIYHNNVQTQKNIFYCKRFLYETSF